MMFQPLPLHKPLRQQVLSHAGHDDTVPSHATFALADTRALKPKTTARYAPDGAN